MFDEQNLTRTKCSLQLMSITSRVSVIASLYLGFRYMYPLALPIRDLVLYCVCFYAVIPILMGLKRASKSSLENPFLMPLL